MAEKDRDQPLLVEVRDSIATLCFNRPAALNAVDVPLAQAFLAAVDDVISRPAVRVLVLKGAGRSFMAGGDLGALHAAGAQVPAAADAMIAAMHGALRKLAAAPQLVVSSVHGPVAGAGMSLALGADLAVAADSAVFSMAYIQVANSPDCGGSWYLSRILGLRKAMELALLGERIGATEALALGLVNRVVAEDMLAAETEALAARLVQLPPLAAASTKALLRQALTNPLNSHLDAERGHFVRNAASADFREGLAAFMARRPAVFRGE